MTQPSSSARSVLITGGNTGLGECAAHELARRGWAVLLTARSPAAGAVAAQRIRAAVPGAQVWALPLDLADLRSVDTLLTALSRPDAPWPPLHALIANAGVQHVSGRERTAQGFEGTFGVNHLGHVQLIRGLLAGTLREPGQIVLVGSGTHDAGARHLLPFPPPYDLSARELADPTRFPQSARSYGIAMMREHHSSRLAQLRSRASGKKYGLAALAEHPAPSRMFGNQSKPVSDVEDARRRYAASKLANTQTGFHLARELTAAGRRIRVSVFDPGLMPGSGLAREYPPLQRLLWHRALPLLARLLPGSASTVERSGRHLAALLDIPEAQGGGYYVQGGRAAGPRPGHASALARDEARARALWEDSLALLDGVHANALSSSPRTPVPGI